MIGTSLPEYVFIRACILFLHLVTPFSIVYVLASWLALVPFDVPRVFHVWLTLEAAFYFVVYLPLRAYLQAPATHPPPGSREDRRQLFLRCHRYIPDPERYLSKWFRDAPASEIRRDNVKDFFRWAFLNTAEPDPAHDEELDEYADEMERLLGRRLQPGRGNAQCLRLTLEKVDMSHRSLLWYLCIAVVDTLTSSYLRYRAFDFHRPDFRRALAVFPLRFLTLFPARPSAARNLTYWHRPHTSKTGRPVLFIHGIGIGLYPYTSFLAELEPRDAGDGQVGIIAIEIMSVSSRLTSEALSKTDMCDEINCILTAHGWDTFVLVSHSYGSIVAAHLLRTPEIAQKIGPVLFIDPIAFLLHLPDVAYNFIYRKPTRANEHQLSYFGSKDIGVSHTLFRRFFWADNILWKEDVRGHHVSVALAERDLIVDTAVVATYLTGGEGEWVSAEGEEKDGMWRGDKLDVMWFRGLDHAQVFDKKRTRQRLVDVVRRYSEE